MLQFSIVTPTFNRREKIGRSVDASLAFATALGHTEIVLVDDASTDGTTELIAGRYSGELSSGRLKIITRKANGGVTAARNEGCRQAQGTWLIFVDSDDELLPHTSAALAQFAEANRESPVLFFRCEDESGRLIGPPMPPRTLDLVALLTQGTPGECLPVVRRTAFLAHPYDEDLRGFELLAYLRIAQSDGPAMLSDVIARRYGTSSPDRLSTLAGRLRRTDLMARGFARMLEEFGPLLPLRVRLALRLRVACYALPAFLGYGR